MVDANFIDDMMKDLQYGDWMRNYATEKAIKLNKEALEHEEKMKNVKKSIVERKQARTTLLRTLGKKFKKYDQNNIICALVNKFKINRRKSLYYGGITDSDLNYILEEVRISFKKFPALKKQKGFVNLMIEISKNESQIDKLIYEYNNLVDIYNHSFINYGSNGYGNLHLFAPPPMPIMDWYNVKKKLLWDIPEL